jgi:hypothetical protein
MLEDGKTTTPVPFADRLQGFLHMLGRMNWLKNKRIATAFYAHPLIKYLAEDNWFSKPAYISSANFSKVMIDLLRGFDDTGAVDIEKIGASIRNGVINKLPPAIGKDLQNPANEALAEQKDDANVEVINPETSLFLRSLWTDAERNLEKFREKLEQWFDDTMDRATGWYKRYTQVILFIVGFLLAIAFNLDSIGIAKKLSRDPTRREQMIQSAGVFLQKQQDLHDRLLEMKNGGDSTSGAYKEVALTYDSISARTNRLTSAATQLMNNDIHNTSRLLALERSGQWGWRFWQWNWLCILGWIITALAISLGAPFWYDLLNRLMKLRGAGVNPDEKKEKRGKGR